jgi:hypothetical protein
MSIRPPKKKKKNLPYSRPKCQLGHLKIYHILRPKCQPSRLKKRAISEVCLTSHLKRKPAA